MSDRLTIYQKNIETIIKKVDESKEINPENRETIHRFREAMESELTRKQTVRKDATKMKLIQDVERIGVLIGENTFEKIFQNEEVFDLAIQKIRKKKEWNENSKAQRTKSLVCLLKTVFRKSPEWLSKKRLGVVGFSPPHENQILTPDEMLKIIESAPSSKTKAIFAILREGLRPAELLRLNVEDISFDGEGRAIICVREGKTGFRNVPTRRGFIFLKNWIAEHPLPKNDIPLFPNTKYSTVQKKTGKEVKLEKVQEWKQRISVEYMIKVNRQSFEKAKIENIRDRKLYNWRKSSITWFLRNGGTLLQASKLFGTSVEMLTRTYASVSTEDLNIAVDAQAGIETPRKSVPSLELPKRCPRCENENPVYEKVCVACGWTLSKNMQTYFDERMKKMEESMRIMQELVTRKIDPNDKKLSKEDVRLVVNPSTLP